jgi:hypothetical protein
MLALAAADGFYVVVTKDTGMPYGIEGQPLNCFLLFLADAVPTSTGARRDLPAALPVDLWDSVWPDRKAGGCGGRSTNEFPSFARTGIPARPQSKPGAYFYRAAVNASLNVIRSRTTVPGRPPTDGQLIAIRSNGSSSHGFRPGLFLLLGTTFPCVENGKQTPHQSIESLPVSATQMLCIRLGPPRKP